MNNEYLYEYNSETTRTTWNLKRKRLLLQQCGCESVERDTAFTIFCCNSGQDEAIYESENTQYIIGF